MSPIFRRSVACLLLLTAACEEVQGANIWLSTSANVSSSGAAQAPPASESQLPVVNHSPSSKGGSLFIWARPDSTLTLNRWSLRVLAERSDVLKLIGADIYNPLLTASSGAPTHYRRWDDVGEPSTEEGALEENGPSYSILDEVNGFIARTAKGIGPQSVGGTAPWKDPLHRTLDAWLLGRIDYELTGLSGTSDIWLQIGVSGISHVGGGLEQTNVVLGASSDVQLNGLHGRTTFSETREARVNVGSHPPVTSADFDYDGDVDGSDFLTWQRNFGLAPKALRVQGDANDDGVVSQSDLSVWRQHSFGSGAIFTSPVPEPQSISMTLCCIIVLLQSTARNRWRDAAAMVFSVRSAKPMRFLTAVVIALGNRQHMKRIFAYQLHRRALPACLAVAAYVFASIVAAQQLKYWDQGGGNNLWTDHANWAFNGSNPTPGNYPGINDIAIFYSGTLGPQVIGLNGQQTVRQVVFQNPSSVSIQPNIPSNSLTLLGDGGYGVIVMPGSSSSSITASVAIGSGQTWANHSTSLLTVSGNVTMGTSLLNIFGSGDTTISGAIGNGGSPSGPLYMSGSGMLRLSGANNYTGGTIISQGTIAFSPNAVPSSGDISVGTATSLVLESAVGGFHSYGGIGRQATFNESSLKFRNTGANASENIFYHDLVLNGAATVSTEGPLAVGRVAGSIVGTGDLFVDGNIRLANSNSFSGQTRLLAGRLRIGHGNALSNSTLYLHPLDFGTVSFDSAISSASIGVLRGTRNLALVNDAGQGLQLTLGGSNLSGSYTGQLTGPGSLTKVGSGTQFLGDVNSTNVVNTYTGDTTVNAGTLNVWPAALPTTGNVTVNAGGTLALGAIGSGVVVYGAPGQLLSLNSGTLAFANAHMGSQNRWDGDIAITGNAVVSVEAAGGRINGSVVGSGGFSKEGNGKLELWGHNSYSGGTSIQEGVLLGDSASFGAGAVNVSSGASIYFQQNVNGEFAPNISGSGTFTKSGNGILKLTGANSISGGTTINDGTLIVNGSLGGPVVINSGGILGGSGTINGNVSGPGRLAPGNSPGIITINGNYTQSPNGTLEIEVGGLTAIPPTPLHDKVIVNGTASLAGAYEFPITPGFIPILNNEIVFLTANSIVGAPDPTKITAPNLHDIAPGLGITVFKNANDLRLRFVTPTALTFVDNTGNPDASSWHQTANWTDSVNNRVPTSSDVVNLTRSQTGNVSQVDVTADAIAHSIAVSDPTSPIAIGVTAGKTLRAATGDITIGNHATVELDGGALSTPRNLNVLNGGQLTGDGTVKGDVFLGQGSGDAATLGPGVTVGDLSINGDYKQAATGKLVIDVDGDADSDILQISGVADLGGTVSFNVVDPNISLGVEYPFLAAGTLALNEKFNNIEISGSSDLYFNVSYQYGAAVPASTGSEVAALTAAAGASYSAYLIGDMNLDGSYNANDAEDLAKFFVSRRRWINEKRLANKNPDDRSANIDGKFDSNFDDLQAFLDDFPQAAEAYYAAYDYYLNAIPEPSGAVLAAAAMTGLVVNRRRKVVA